jgi:hypothetical protein
VASRLVAWHSVLPVLALLGRCAAFALLAPIALLPVRVVARTRRRYVRLRLLAYRGDDPTLEELVSVFAALHKRLQRRWWRRLVLGQPSIAVELHYDREAWFALSFPLGLSRLVQAAVRDAYPNCALDTATRAVGSPPSVLRLKKHAPFTKRVRRFMRFEHERTPTIDRLITAMGACGEPVFVQLALTPAPALFERYAKYAYKRHEAHLSRARKLRFPPLDPSLVERAELLGGLDVQHQPLFFADIRVVASTRPVCERIAAELRAGGAENRLVERGTAVRHRLFGCYERRVLRGEGNPCPSWRKGVLAATELAGLWHLPSVGYAIVPVVRAQVPVAPAPPGIMRPSDDGGVLRDEYGGVAIHTSMRRQNTAVPGTVEQGKSSYLVASVAEDLRRERCAVIVLDPKGDAAEASISIVPAQRTCTLLDFAHPTCGFNPLAVAAPADTIADYVVAALKNLFDEGDIRASSDRYLRNAIIAVLAHDRRSTLWDAARLLSVGEDGYAYRARVAAALRTKPEYKEISEFFTAELTAQLADARGSTTAKLDAPVNKLARLLNSPSIKRVLLNDSLRIDFDRVIAEAEVLVVKGALGTMGAGNTSVLMQLLVGMLDAALARRQDGVAANERTAVALKVDEAPLVLNRGFAETMALKRSAGLETVACWQTDSQWTDRDIRAQLDALFAHRVYFATASAEDSRAAAKLLMASYSDVVRPDIRTLSALGRPDARLHLPRHWAIASWVTPQGRQAPFVAQTIPLALDPVRLAHHARRQVERGARYREDLSQPHWDRPARVRTQARGAVGDQATEARPEQPAHAATRGGGPVEERGAAARRPPASARTAPGGHLDEDDEMRGVSASVAAEGYRELVALEAAHSVRWAKPVLEPIRIDPESLDLDLLELIGSLRHLLSSQIHRRFNPDRTRTTTQRRLKRLSDAGLVARFQFHRRDGGGMPMCYSITVAGRRLCAEHGRLNGEGSSREGSPPTGGLQGTTQPLAATESSVGPHSAAGASGRSGRSAQALLRQARHDVRVAGWVLALEAELAGKPALSLIGPEDSAISPPLRHSASGRRAVSLAELRFQGGGTPHDFLRTSPDGARVEVDRFQTVRPDVTVRARTGCELLVELDDRLPDGDGGAKLERYDHFLSGWSALLGRYSVAPPLVVFVCRDRSRARRCARAADHVLVAARAYPGEYPSAWEYPARVGTVFVAERDVYDGVLSAWGVPALPPGVRSSGGGPAAREPMIEVRELSLAR